MSRILTVLIEGVRDIVQPVLMFVMPGMLFYEATCKLEFEEFHVIPLLRWKI